MKVPIKYHGEVKAFAEVDDDMVHVSSLDWTLLSQDEGRRSYAIRRYMRQVIYMHSLILPKKSGYVVDHIDGNGLNNKRENLRYVTISQNAANAFLSRRNKSGVKGLSIEVMNGYCYWCAAVRKDGVVHRKRFPIDRKEDAAEWVKQKRIELHGEYGNHGLPIPQLG